MNGRRNMRFIMRGTMSHILLKENSLVEEIVQDIMLAPPEKYYIEIHLTKNSELESEVVSIIILNTDTSFGNIVRTLEYFATKYSKMQDPKYNSISHEFLQIIDEMQRMKPLYPKNLFRFDNE